MLDLQALSKIYESHSPLGWAPRHRVVALDQVSLRLEAGQSLGLVGESGSGKTTLAKILAGFTDATSGQILLNGLDLLTMRRHERAPLVQMVFQDPFGSLNPKLLLRVQMDEALRQVSPRDVEARAHRLMDDVGLAALFLSRYPHQLSGGQRQRFAIARALAMEPSLLIADEPVSSLDLSVQAQILNLLNDLRSQHRFSQILISHDLTVIAQTCEQIAVLYQGRIVETGETSRVLRAPNHPVTQRLLAAAAHL